YHRDAYPWQHSSLFFFSSRRRHTRWPRDWSSDVCSSDLDVDFLRPDRRPYGGAARAAHGTLHAQRATELSALDARTIGFGLAHEIGRASCRERVGVLVGAGGLEVDDCVESVNVPGVWRVL